MIGIRLENKTKGKHTNENKWNKRRQKTDDDVRNSLAVSLTSMRKNEESCKASHRFALLSSRIWYDQHTKKKKHKVCSSTPARLLLRIKLSCCSNVFVAVFFVLHYFSLFVLNNHASKKNSLFDKFTLMVWCGGGYTSFYSLSFRFSFVSIHYIPINLYMMHGSLNVTVPRRQQFQT